MTTETLKTVTVDGTEFILTRTYTHKHTKGTIKTVTTYTVQRSDYQDDNLNRYRFTAKAAATKYLNSLTSKAVVTEYSGVNALNRLYGV